MMSWLSDWSRRVDLGTISIQVTGDLEEAKVA